MDELDRTLDEYNVLAVALVDVVDQVLRGVGPQEEGVTPIQAVTRLDGNIILQGAEDGRSDEEDSVGWSMSIDQKTGKMIFSASREKAGFIIFGSCVETH